MNKFLLPGLEHIRLRAYPREVVHRPVKPKLQILLLEDDSADAELIAHELEASGLEFELSLIHSETALRRELEAKPIDLVLSDHGLPAFDGFKALELVRELNPDVPFIFVSGSNDQGMVARMYFEGATDYVFKSDLTDLPSAVRDALSPPVAPPPQTSAPAHEPPAASPLIQVAFARLWLCPSCLRARDENGATVDFLEYFRQHNELVVLHELCAACQPAMGLREVGEV